MRLGRQWNLGGEGMAGLQNCIATLQVHNSETLLFPDSHPDAFPFVLINLFWFAEAAPIFFRSGSIFSTLLNLSMKITSCSWTEVYKDLIESKLCFFWDCQKILKLSLNFLHFLFPIGYRILCNLVTSVRLTQDSEVVLFPVSWFRVGCSDKSWGSLEVWMSIRAHESGRKFAIFVNEMIWSLT